MILISDKNKKNPILFKSMATPCTCYSILAKMITSGPEAASWTTAWLTSQSPCHTPVGQMIPKLRISICFFEHSWHKLLQLGFPLKSTLSSRLACQTFVKECSWEPMTVAERERKQDETEKEAEL